MEVHLVECDRTKYVVRQCKSEKKAKFYEKISNELSNYNILPKIIKRLGKNVFYDYLQGRDLTRVEKLKVFEQIGAICAIINNIQYSKKSDINYIFNKHLYQLTTGKFKTFTEEEMRRKKARRPNERYDKRRIKALLTKKESDKIKRINSTLILDTDARVCFDAVDVSPANFRLSKGRVYFVDMDAISPRILGIGIAKCFFNWAKTKKQKESFFEGYISISRSNIFTEKYMDLLQLHFLIESLHDRVKLGREYKIQYKNLKTILNKY